MAFYDNLIKLCVRDGVTPSGVARKVGLSNAAANGWKKGKSPSDVTLEKLAQFFDVEVSELIKEAKNAESPAPEGAGLTETQQEAMAFIQTLSEHQLRQFLRIGRAMLDE